MDQTPTRYIRPDGATDYEAWNRDAHAVFIEALLAAGVPRNATEAAKLSEPEGLELRQGVHEMSQMDGLEVPQMEEREMREPEVLKLHQMEVNEMLEPDMHELEEDEFVQIEGFMRALQSMAQYRLRLIFDPGKRLQ